MRLAGPGGALPEGEGAPPGYRAGGGQRAGAGPRQDVPEDEASDGGDTEAGQAQCGHVAGQVTIIVEARERIIAPLPSAAGSAALRGAGTRQWR